MRKPYLIIISYTYTSKSIKKNTEQYSSLCANKSFFFLLNIFLFYSLQISFFFRCFLKSCNALELYLLDNTNADDIRTTISTLDNLGKNVQSVFKSQCLKSMQVEFKIFSFILRNILINSGQLAICVKKSS